MAPRYVHAPTRQAMHAGTPLARPVIFFSPECFRPLFSPINRILTFLPASFNLQTLNLGETASNRLIRQRPYHEEKEQSNYANHTNNREYRPQYRPHRAHG